MSVNIKGKQYSTVAERLHEVHQSGARFEVIASNPMQCGPYWVWTVVVEVDGRRYQGSAQVHLEAKPGTADATDAWACAETSAVGRAIAFAGWLSDESIASADEIVRSR